MLRRCSRIGGHLGLLMGVGGDAFQLADDGPDGLEALLGVGRG